MMADTKSLIRPTSMLCTVFKDGVMRVSALTSKGGDVLTDKAGINILTGRAA